MVDLSRLRELTEAISSDIYSHEKDCKTLDLLKMIFDNIGIYAQIIDKDYKVIYSNPMTIKYLTKMNVDIENMYLHEPYKLEVEKTFKERCLRRFSWVSPTSNKVYDMTLIPIMDNGATAMLVFAQEG